MHRTAADIDADLRALADVSQSPGWVSSPGWESRLAALVAELRTLPAPPLPDRFR